MKLVHARSECVVRRYVNLIDGPEIAHPDSSVRGKKIVLTKVEIHFVLVAGEWRVSGGASQNVYGEGWILKGDGSRSQRQWKGQIMTAPVRTENGWLKKLIDGCRPQGQPELPFDVAEV
jgi:hypothetical protein